MSLVHEPLFADPLSEESDDNEHLSDLHVLVLTPGNMLEEADLIMLALRSSVDTNISLREAVESSIGSPGFSSD